jgi:hypothetical protein
MSDYTFHTRFTAEPIELLNSSLEELVRAVEATYETSLSEFVANIGDHPQLFMITWRDAGKNGPAEPFSIDGRELRINQSGKVETLEDERVVGDSLPLIPGGIGKKGRAIIGFTV